MVEKYMALIDREIRKQKFGKEPVSLYNPLRYIMWLGGKRLRPLLTLLSYSLFQKDISRIVTSAVAVEVFHNFTLLHDDIMDKAPLRRGEQTVHEKWDVNTAILSGDVMLVKVYEMLLEIPGDKLKEALKAFNKCATEVCEGQQQDMEFEKVQKVSEREYINMIGKKTASLLGFSLELGAILGDAPPGDRKALREFGLNIGIGFQLRDDLLDVYADKQKFGKQVGGDIIANKKTFLLINALSRAKGNDANVLSRWLKSGKNKKIDRAKVREVTAIYDKLNIKSITERKINTYFEQAFKQLDQMNVAVNKKRSLREYVENLANRQH